MVPILGTGFRRWLLRGARAPAGLTDWGALLQGVAHTAGLEPAPTDVEPSVAFEHLVRQRPMDISSAHKWEQTLATKHIARWMRTVADMPSIRQHVEPRSQRFLQVGWRDVVDLNVDPLLTGDQAVVTQKSHTRKARTLQLSVTRNAKQTRIWCPHGSAVRGARTEALVFGLQRYGRSVAGAVKAHDRARANRDAAREPELWTEMLQDRPVLLLGTGLASSDWDVAWALVAQGRRRPAPHVFRLTCTEEPEEDRHRSRSLLGDTLFELHGGPTWADAWKRLGQVIPALDPSTPQPAEG